MKQILKANYTLQKSSVEEERMIESSLTDKFVNADFLQYLELVYGVKVFRDQGTYVDGWFVAAFISNELHGQ